MKKLYTIIFGSVLTLLSFSVVAQVPSFTSVQTNNNCFGDSTGSITITAFGGTPPYQYSVNGGVNYQSSAIFSGLLAGTFPLVVSDTNNIISTIDTVTITEPNLVTTNQTLTICHNDSIIIGSTVHHTTGIYTDTLVTFSGCDSIVITNLTVHPALVITVNSLIGICPGHQGFFTANGGTTYTWSAGIIPTGGNTATIYANANATYTVTGTTGGCSGTAIATVTLAAPLGVTMSPFNPDTLCFNSGSFTLVSGSPFVSGYSTYQGAGVSGSLGMFTFTPSAAGLGSHVITYSYSNGWCSGTASQTVTIISCANAGIGEHDLLSNISIYPNPTSGQFALSLPTNMAEIVVTNALGQQILKTQTTQRTTNLQLDNNGVYFVYITTKEGTTTRKLIVNR